MRSFLVAIACCTLALSCDDSHDESRPAECKEILEACHEVDKGSGMIHTCHESSEEGWTKEQCAANRQTCLSVCTAAKVDGGAGQ